MLDVVFDFGLVGVFLGMVSLDLEEIVFRGLGVLVFGDVVVECDSDVCELCVLGLVLFGIFFFFSLFGFLFLLLFVVICWNKIGSFCFLDGVVILGIGEMGLSNFF